MAFPLNLTSALTGASISQLRRWSRGDLLVPEDRQHRPMLYSFRDLIALRTIVFLRNETSLQRVRRALSNLDVIDMTEHPSAYTFATDGRTIGVVDEMNGQVVDLVRSPGQTSDLSLASAFEKFTTKSGRAVSSFLQPRPRIAVSPRRMGGWPTVQGTRITYDAIADLVDNRTIFPADVPSYYPVELADVEDALDFAREVKSA